MKPLYTRKKARSSLVHTAFFRALSQLATMLSYIVLVRAMPEHDFGIFNLLYAVIPVVSTIASFGLEQTLRRFQPEYLQAGNTAAAARLVRMVSRGRLASSFLVLGTILLAWNSVAHFFGLGPYRGQFALFCLVVLLYFQTNILQMTLASHMLHRFSVGMLSVLAVAKLIAYLLISWLGTLDLDTAILADATAYVVTYAGLRYAHWRYCSVPAEQRTFRFAPAERRRLLRYGFFNNLNDAGAMALNVRTDNFFIAALMNPYAVGAYAFYVRLTLMATRILPTKMFENVVQPLFFSIPSQQADQRVPRYFTALLNTSLLTQLPLAAYAFAYHREIVEVLFAGKFVEHSWLLPLVFMFSTINVLGIPVTLVAQHAERTSILLTSKILAIWNVAGLLLLVPPLGIYGAAIASGSAEAMKNLFVWWHVRHRARWTNGVSMIVSTLVVWGSVVAVCLLLKAAFEAKPVVHLIVGALITTVGALIFVRSPALSSTDREVLASVLHGREARALRWLGLFPAR
jgi:O-antigen/teichoic acid export membrane protein